RVFCWSGALDDLVDHVQGLRRVRIQLTNRLAQGQPDRLPGQVHSGGQAVRQAVGAARVDLQEDRLAVQHASLHVGQVADVQLLHHDPGDAVDLRVAAECARVPALAARDGCDHLTGRGPENVHTGLWGAHDRGDDERR